MPKRLVFVALALLCVAALIVPVSAQVATTTPTLQAEVNPNANITWPPPVYVLRGEFEVRGTANLPNQSNYFIEFRPLNDDLTPIGTDQDWFPATLPSSAPVEEDVLGVWDTSLVPDGLYELRLTVNVSAGDPVVQTVAPIRIENTPPPFAPLPTATSAALTLPTTSPATAVPPTATPDGTPRATITTPNGNVRTGDSTNYPIIVGLPQGTELRIVGISSTGSGWYRVQTPNGQLGFVSPTIVTTTGDLTGLPGVIPPPPPPTAVPTIPPIVATLPPVVQPSQANLVAGIALTDPAQPRCGETFTIGLDVANLGTQATTIDGGVNLVDVRAADGSSQGSTFGAFGIIQPGQTVRVNMRLTVSTFYNETHRINLTIDPGNAIGETNEGDNLRTIEYTLEKGNCP